MNQGSVTNAADVAKCITKDTTGVIVSLGGKTKDVGPTMLTDGTRNVIEVRSVLFRAATCELQNVFHPPLSRFR